MLKNLYVKNLALIDEAEVSFDRGLHILTGETGAGKSVLIGSVSLALGQKMSREIVRDETKPCVVELTFYVEDSKTEEKLLSIGAAPEDGQLIITRKIADGRSVFRLNGETCTAAKIRQISSLLLEIHGQHEHQSLLRPERQLEILDAYGGEQIRSLLKKNGEAWERWHDLEQKLEEYQIDESQREREMAFLQYEISEIEEAALVTGEDEVLEQTYRRMANGKKIAGTLEMVHHMTGYEEGAGDILGRAARELQTVTEYDARLSDMADALAAADDLLNDFNRELSDYQDSLSFSDEEFFETEKRLDLLNHMKARYGHTIEEILQYRDRQKEALEKLENFAEQKAGLEAQKAQAEKELAEAGRILSARRKECAEDLSSAIASGLKELNFLSSEFSVRISDTGHYGRNGKDAVEFMISVNPGEPLRELRKVSSGGELSRIMLAIKTLLSDRDETETLIFDEIDTGISGRTAQAVSEKLARIAGEKQVICITHLAQIAAMADHHYEIVKTAGPGDHTCTEIRELNQEESVRELARILGGAEITGTVVESAREMKRLAREKTHVLRSGTRT